ncbi:MAG: FKBP-type peptidyl-prolyl cis-trans isomerase FkpA [Parvicella sp.]
MFQNEFKMKTIVPFILAILLVTSCAKKKAREQAEADEQIILSYIENNNLDAVATETGLYYVIDTLGTGVYPVSTDNVRVAYKGYLTDGEVFDESSSAGISFGLQNVIRGWTEGIPYFKEGGSGILLIPSHLGYGKSGTSGIPGNSVLIFDVKLIEVL